MASKKSNKNPKIGTVAQPRDGGKRSYLSQTEVPSRNLVQALRIASAIADNYGKKPARPLRVAQALSIEPSSSNFRALCGASIAYGLTTGGYNADEIALTPLGKRIVSPTTEGDDLAAKREAILKPKVVRDFLEHYDGSAVPQEQIGRNVLEEMGVPQERTENVFTLIMQSAKDVGFIQEVKGKSYVDLKATVSSPSSIADVINNEDDEQEEDPSGIGNTKHQIEKAQEPAPAGTLISRRVFITHGRNHAFIEPIKKLLQFGELEPVVAMERQTVSQPLTDKVMGEMRSCGAAIIHIDDEKKLIDSDGNQHVVLNPNVLIEIGAAIALYGGRFILLVKDGIELPSNLKGLYEVRYTGEALDSDITIKLLEAIKEMKTHQAPQR